MSTIQHILFPIDFSPRSLAAAPFVEAMANRFRAKVTMLNVVEPITYPGMDEPGVPIYVDPEDLRSSAQTRLDRTLVEEFAGIPVTRIAEVGDPASAITEHAHKHAVDLIMMPTHGYGPFRRFLLGSVTAKVLHDARCPVWTGMHMEDPPMLEHLSSKSVLCAVDNSQASGCLMQWAARYATHMSASLRLIHAVPGAEAFPEWHMDQEFIRAVQEQARDQIVSIQKAAGVNAPLCINAGDVASVVREEALRHKADMIVIGRGVIHETLGRLRTHAHIIIRQAPCPVISV